MLFEPPGLDVELDVLDLIGEAQQSLRWTVRDPRRWSGSLRRVAQARSVQGSNSIEGYHAPLDDVLAMVDGEEPLDASDETSEAIRGYRDAMTFVLQMARQDRSPSIDESLLRSLHFMMLKYDLTKNPGGYRPGAIWVQRESDGRPVYEAPDVELVVPLMGQLVDRLGIPSDHALVDGAMAHLNLVLIHPFSDGNGRMARAIQTLVIARERLLAPEFNSIEEYLGRNTQAYYEVLTEVATGSWKPHRSSRPWIRFCLVAHYRQLQTLLRRTAEAEALWAELDALLERGSLPSRAASALYDASLGLRIRNRSYRAAIETSDGLHLSEQTASRDLKLLTEADLLVPHGERRGRHYVAGAPIIELRASVRSSRSVALADPFDLVAPHRRANPVEPRAPG